MFQSRGFYISMQFLKSEHEFTNTLFPDFFLTEKTDLSLSYPDYLKTELNSEESENSTVELGDPLSLSSLSSSPTVHLPNMPTPDERGFRPILQNRNFLFLWGGQIFSQLADKVYLVLMIAIISAQFQQEGQTISGWVAAVMIAFTIPAVLFGAAAGVYVDRWPKKAVLVLTNLLKGVLILLLPVVLSLSSGAYLGGFPLGFYLLLLITFLVSTLTQFFAPAEQAIIPLMVKKHHLLSANSLYTTTMMASVIIGFAVGEPLLALADTLMGQSSLGVQFGKELIIGGAYLVSGLFLIAMNLREKDWDQPDPPHVLTDLREGWNYLRNHSKVRNAMVQLIILFSIFAALAVLAVRLAELIPNLKSSQFGVLLAAGGLGMGIGAITLGQVGHRFSHSELALLGCLGIASSLVGLAGFGQQLWLALGCITVLGAFAAVVAIPMQTTIQAETPEDMRGKVFGLQNNAVNIALSLPLALAGMAETYLGLPLTFLGLALLALGGGGLTWYISR